MWYPLYLKNELLYKKPTGSFDKTFCEGKNVVLDDLVKDLRSEQQSLHSISVFKIVDYLDEFCRFLKGHALYKDLRVMGLPYLVEWLSNDHFGKILDSSLLGNRRCLDEFIPFGNNRKIRAQPRGLVVQWLSGNIPLLGFLSLIQSLVTKNVTLVKVSNDNSGFVPVLLKLLAEVSPLSRYVAALYVDRDDIDSQEILSKAANVRVAWGGKQSVEAILDLPRSWGSEDIIFGPKYSYMVIGKECLKKEKIENLATRAAFDISVFDQQGCNSPHTIFVERGGEVEPGFFAEALSVAMSRVIKLIPPSTISAGEAAQILKVRAEYDLRAMAYFPQGSEWTVLYSDDDKGLAEPCFVRTVFVRPVDDVMESAEFASHKTQSIGLEMDNKRQLRFADRATFLGAERCPPVGEMSYHESPWDGLFMIDRLVRWVTAPDAAV